MYGFPHWITYQHSKPVAFNHIKIESGQLWFPKDFDIIAYNNPENKTTLKSITGESGWTAHSIHEYSFLNDNSYQYYEIIVNSVQSGAHVEFAEIEFK